jgi:adenosylmethionine-8-amino-7-oxononanoate aminotransferase
MLYTGRSKFLSLEGSYHGNSIATISIGDSDSAGTLPNKLGNCVKLGLPLDEQALRKAERLLGRKDIAAFIMEPVSCNLGVMVPDHLFMKRMGRLCRKYGTLLIMDEVACGFGRTGKLFASEHFEIEPDIITLAKAMSGGYGGLGAAVTTERIASKALRKGFSLYSTYGWHPRAVSAAIANIRYWNAHKEKLFRQVEESGAQFQNRLVQMKFRHGSEIHLVGLTISVDVRKKNYAAKIGSRCREKGLIITTQGEKLVLFPALNIEKEVIGKAMDILEGCT